MLGRVEPLSFEIGVFSRIIAIGTARVCERLTSLHTQSIVQAGVPVILFFER
jgi:hypothetical protein